MDRILEFLHFITPYLHIIAAISFVVKAVFVFRNKGFDLPSVITSFFRIYSRSDMYMTNNNGRRVFMRLNNAINYYIYGWILVTLIVFVVFQLPAYTN